MSDLAQRFADAQARIKPVTGLGNDVMLDLYALYKQATEGDVTGKRPGFTNPVGRAKYDAWVEQQGLSAEEARDEYVTLVHSITG